MIIRTSTFSDVRLFKNSQSFSLGIRGIFNAPFINNTPMMSPTSWSSMFVTRRRSVFSTAFNNTTCCGILTLKKKSSNWRHLI
jgi:hypothetical protein